MYVRVFKGRDYSESYTLEYIPAKNCNAPGDMFIENEKHVRHKIHELDLFSCLHAFFVGIKNERQNEESRESNGQKNQRV